MVNPETKDPECGGVKYWFHSGNEFTTQADWTEYDNKIKEQACIKDRSDALSQKKEWQIYIWANSRARSMRKISLVM